MTPETQPCCSKDAFLETSIYKTIAALFLIETAVFFGLYRLYRLSSRFFFIFLGAEAVFHGIVLVFLLFKKEYFFNVKTGLPETKVNITNKITLFRITMLPFLLFLLFASRARGTGPALIIAFAVTFASDFVDGRIARAKNMETWMGRILDSASDYLLLGFTAAGFYLFGLIRRWLFLLIVGRLLLNSVGIFILSLVRKKLTPQTTWFGKVAIAAIMILFVVEAAALFAGDPFWVNFVEIAASVIVVISMGEKIADFAKALRPA
jgi:phosphatidylglycerophosphate synthase